MTANKQIQAITEWLKERKEMARENLLEIRQDKNMNSYGSGVEHGELSICIELLEFISNGCEDDN